MVKMYEVLTVPPGDDLPTEDRPAQGGAGGGRREPEGVLGRDGQEVPGTGKVEIRTVLGGVQHSEMQ